jgi:hypothetical protein
MKKPKMSLCELGFKFFRLGCCSSDYKKSIISLQLQISSSYVENLRRYEGKTEKPSSLNGRHSFLKLSHKLFNIPG